MPNAARTYATDQATCHELLVRLEQALKGHAQRAALDADNWGYVGDLGTVIQSLRQGLEMLGAATSAEQATKRHL